MATDRTIARINLFSIDTSYRKSGFSAVRPHPRDERGGTAGSAITLRECPLGCRSYGEIRSCTPNSSGRNDSNHRDTGIPAAGSLSGGLSGCLLPARERFLPRSPTKLYRGKEFGGNRCEIRIPGCFPHHDGRSGPHRKNALVVPVEFPEETLYPVPNHRVPHPPADGDPDFPRNGDAPLSRGGAEIPVDAVVRRGCARPPANHIPVFAVGAQHFRLGQPNTPHPRLGLPKSGYGYFLPLTETASRFRPFARRREMICLPAGVDMRRRNPWVRRRRLLCGW
jgi:hypothetical protein